MLEYKDCTEPRLASTTAPHSPLHVTRLQGTVPHHKLSGSWISPFERFLFGILHFTCASLCVRISSDDFDGGGWVGAMSRSFWYTNLDLCYIIGLACMITLLISSLLCSIYGQLSLCFSSRQDFPRYITPYRPESTEHSKQAGEGSKVAPVFLWQCEAVQSLVRIGKLCFKNSNRSLLQIYEIIQPRPLFRKNLS